MMPIDIELDGYFSCKKGETDYKIKYVHHPGDTPLDKLYYCESVRYQMHIRPDGRVAPCMGFSDSALGDKFESVLEEHLGDITLKSFYHDVVETKVLDLANKNPDCLDCEHLRKCCGGCMVQGITEEGDFLIPDDQICNFYKNIGEDAVREVADNALERLGLK